MPDIQPISTIQPIQLTDQQKTLIAKMLKTQRDAQAHRITKFGATRVAKVAAPSALASAPGGSLLHDLVNLWQLFGIEDEPFSPPPQLGPFNTGYPVDLDPVYGWSQLVLFQDGSYNFTGDFHNDSDIASYQYSFVWGVIGESHILYTFSHKGSLSPTYGLGGGGSSDDSWSTSGSNPALKDGWAGLSDDCSCYWQASSSLDVVALLNELVTAVKAVQTVVQVVEVLAAAL